MTIRFEIILNGKQLCIVGQDGFGVLSQTITWCLRNPDKMPSSKYEGTMDEWLAEELQLSISGLDSNELTGTRSISWVPREGLSIKRGDEITIRILEGGTFDPPTHVSPKWPDST